MKIKWAPEDEAAIRDWATGDDELTDKAFEFAFEHFANSGEMPYGVMKARTGDPYNWIAENLGSWPEDQILDFFGLDELQDMDRV
jgi:hypothetical protein